MNTQPALDIRIGHYLARLESALHDLPSHQTDDIVREIRAHIVERLETSPDRQATVERVLASFGDPEDLAERYRTEFMLARAAHSYSPWLLLKTTGRWAMTGIRGFAVFMVAMVGYSMAAGFYLTAMLKPFMPTKVGLWVGRGSFDFGVRDSTEGVHELLGAYYTPVTLVLGILAVIGTTLLLRLLIRAGRSKQGKLQAL